LYSEIGGCRRAVSSLLRVRRRRELRKQKQESHSGIQAMSFTRPLMIVHMIHSQ